MKNPKIQGRKESLIARELTIIITQKLEDPILKSVSISEVRLVHDNEVAKVYYSFIKFSGQDINREVVARHLEENEKKIRMMLASKVDMRRVPELEFIFDESLENANRINEILNETK
ncbi:30S ribosome-binding factor RbfA [Mesoplasma lactucae]|uniref:Ribosome-binding factor A n=1 Tax=Mesoplasma lactucae ATCC 49193 TaxID=81460 RepID=A0A291IRT0_9MOLU|nr:30S ribosome-binding factor RbfA [Mesoplasma lactucae]ATG97454.1 ribosome-binding factor A [Mesoplasma lactucae ATCC 49193]ATZ20091.1 ribosome-binding factor A [Mesoplasma lactucae ATCC 49193]MCL8216839.1 Ribosome-binding factor A [Mesoplasma lactucae ATCC 49193]